MLLNKLAPLLALGACLDVAFCALNIDQTVANINAIKDSAQEVHDAMQAYNGGLREAIPLAKTVQSSQKVTRRATKDLDANSEQFSDEETRMSLDAYKQMTPVVVEALNMAVQKAPALRESGVGSVAHGMLSSLYDEKNDFEEAYIRKLPKNGRRAISPHDEEVDAVFKKAIANLSS